MHRTTRRWVTGGATLGAAALLAVPAVVFAQSGGTDPTTSTTSTTVPATSAPSTTEAPPGSSAPSTKVPSEKSPESWIKGVLDGLVKDGTITQAQEDAIIKALHDAKPALGDRPFGHGGPHGDLRIGFGLDEVAKALGITVDELRTELQTKTIAEIAKAHGIDVQKVIDDVTATAKTALDNAVEAGRITQAEADARLTALEDKLTQLVDQKLPLPDKAERHHDERDEGGSTTPSSAPTTTTG